MTKSETAIATVGVSGLPALPAREADESTQLYAVRLMEMLPPPDEDVMERIGERIFASENMAEENAIWDSATGSKDAVGRRFIFHSCHLLDSDYEESWSPYYLICKVTDRETGEGTVLTTGSENIVKSLVKAQILGDLPWEGEIVGPRKPTKKNRLPLHIRWLGKVVEAED